MKHPKTTTHAVSQVNGFGKVDARLGGYPNPEKRLLDSYLLSCDVPEAARHRIPVSVSLLTSECPGDEAASNNLKIFSNKYTLYITVHDICIIKEFDRNTNNKKEGIAVCSKSLSHIDDTSIKFMEWIEVLRLQGVKKIVLYVLDVHPNVMKVIPDILDYCQARVPNPPRPNPNPVQPSSNPNKPKRGLGLTQ